MSFLKEIHRRRTFGIISHPDAGKTTQKNYSFWWSHSRGGCGKK
jgi:peptide subunit release factor RF-3